MSVGRPRVEIDWSKLDGMLMYGATCLEVANELDCAEDTVVRHIKEKHGVNFKDYREKKMGSIRLRLRQKQIRMALDGNVALLIFLGKNLLGQSDKQETTFAVGENSEKLVLDLSGTYDPKKAKQSKSGSEQAEDAQADNKES